MNRRVAPAKRFDEQSLRLRAAWLYYSHGMTQQAVATKLGIGRSTVVRLLENARERQEVQFWIDDGDAVCTGLGVRLELALGIDEAVVVPAAKGANQIARSVGLALGKMLSTCVVDDVTLGVGWGRTLTASLESFHPPPCRGVRVMALLGGALESRISNPVEFAWRIASVLDAQCYLFPAPLIVDSKQTKSALIENCGLNKLYTLAKSLDIAVVSVGDIGANCSSLSKSVLSPVELEEIVDAGCIADVMCNFLDANGESVEHPLNDRVMSVNLDTVARAGHKVIASGGAARAPAILAAIRRIGCNALVTDESAAEAMLSRLERLGSNRG